MDKWIWRAYCPKLLLVPNIIWNIICSKYWNLSRYLKEKIFLHKHSFSWRIKKALTQGCIGCWCRDQGSFLEESYIQLSEGILMFRDFNNIHCKSKSYIYFSSFQQIGSNLWNKIREFVCLFFKNNEMLNLWKHRNCRIKCWTHWTIIL